MNTGRKSAVFRSQANRKHYFSISLSIANHNENKHYKLMSADLFSKQADLYSRFRPQYPTELYDFLIKHSGNADLAWDCATGNGQAAVGLSPFFKRIIATDLSAQQIAQAMPASNVEYRVLRAEETLHLDDRSVDLITVAQALHWFDLDKFYKEVKRLLKTNGIFATWGYSFHAPIDPEIDSQLNDFYFNTLGSFWKPNNKLIWDNYKDLSFPFLELATPKVELSVDWSLDDLIGYFKTWSATQLFIERHEIDPTVPLKEKILLNWGNAHEPKRLTWNLAFRVGRHV